MTGEEIYNRELNKGGEYAKTLFNIYSSIYHSLYPYLEQAENTGKQISITPLTDDAKYDKVDIEKRIIFI
jgi:aromatic ring-cleaving dioxygenase